MAALLQPATEGLLVVKISQFSVLSEDGGMLGLDYGEFHPVLITRIEGAFNVLQGICPHASGRVIPNGSELLCTNHGSRFNLSGTSFAGPATGKSLPEFPFIHNTGLNQLEITVPNLAYRVTAFALVGEERLAITFETMAGYRYEIRYRSGLGEAESVAFFSTSTSGPLDTAELLGNGTARTVYVGRSGPAGFYAVNLKVSSFE